VGHYQGAVLAPGMLAKLDGEAVEELFSNLTCLPSRSIGSCREIISLAGDELKITHPAVASKPPSEGAITEHNAAITELVFKRAK
jgi:hypothetical protein